MKRKNKIAIGVLLFIVMIFVLIIVNHFCLNHEPIVLQAIVSGVIASFFTVVYMIFVWRR